MGSRRSIGVALIVSNSKLILIRYTHVLVGPPRDYLCRFYRPVLLYRFPQSEGRCRTLKSNLGLAWIRTQPGHTRGRLFSSNSRQFRPPTGHVGLRKRVRGESRLGIPGTSACAKHPASPDTGPKGQKPPCKESLD